MDWRETLSQVHQRRGNFSVTEVTELLSNILPILDYIHAHHIIHRDIKPDNIIVRAIDGQPVLIDFGIVKEAVATMINSNGKTAYSIAWGTPGYMPSEQAAGRPVYSSDLYSLGLTAVFLLTGKTPQYLEIDPHTGKFSGVKKFLILILILLVLLIALFAFIRRIASHSKKCWLP